MSKIKLKLFFDESGKRNNLPTIMGAFSVPGYETKLSEESSNAPVMILDEATSSIDSRTEATVQKGMDELIKGRTVFVIAHRLSTVRNADNILVLDHGRIIERGNHEELISKKGAYYQLYEGSSNSFDETNLPGMPPELKG